MLIDARRAAGLRNIRAHGPIPASACLDSMDALEQMSRALGVDESKRDQIRDLLQKCQRLVGLARRARNRGDIDAKSKEDGPASDRPGYESLWFYAALNDFEVQLKQQTGKFAITKVEALFGAERGDLWPDPCKKAIKDAKMKDIFKMITKTRHWLFTPPQSNHRTLENS